MKIQIQEKSYDLEPKNCIGFMEDEEQPLKDFDLEMLLSIIEGKDRLYFDTAYYDIRCDECQNNKSEGGKYYRYYEAHFYIFIKDGQYKMSSLDEDYQEQSLSKLLKQKIVDGSYMVSMNICPSCGAYSVELEYGLF